jgi:hypothetical protein
LERLFVRIDYNYPRFKTPWVSFFDFDVSRMLRVGAFWPVVSVLLLLVAACSSGDDGTSTVFAPATPDAPSPTETVIDVSGAMAGELTLATCRTTLPN